MQSISLTVEQVAKRNHLSRQSIYNEINAGRLRSFKVGKSRRITERAESEWICEREAEANVA